MSPDELKVAIRENDLNAVKEAIEGGMPLDVDLGSVVPLTLAVKHRHHAIVQYLLERGADANVSGVFGQMPLHLASEPEIAGLLLEHGAEPDVLDQRGGTPLQIAAANGKTAMIKFLLEHGAAVDLPNEEGGTPLMAACTHGESRAVKLLVEAGADVNHRGHSNRTPLHQAVQGNQKARTTIIGQLLSAGADINATDDAGYTPLMDACYNDGSVGIVQTLLDHGADVNVKGMFGRTAWSIAREEERDDLLPLLEAAGATPSE